MKPILSSAEAGSTNLLETVPRAALRSTSFRCACPGLNSVAGDAGSLRGSCPSLVFFSVLSITLFLFAGCSKSNQPMTNAPSRAVPNVRSSADVVKVRALPFSLAAGAGQDLIVILSISPGFHVNANPATFPYLIATDVTSKGTEGISVGKSVYPVSEKKKFQFAEELLAVYEGEAPIRVPLRAESNAARGTRSLPIDVRVQACDQEECFPPDTLHTTIAVEVK